MPKDQLARVHREVKAGRADSVSGYIAGVLEEQEKRESLRELMQDLIEQHGEPTRTRAATGIVLDAGALIALERGDKR